MKDPQYPERQYGLERVNMSFDPPAAFKRAMKLYQIHHLAKYGYKPSINDVLVTSVLQHNDKFRCIFRDEEKKGSKYGRKYIDCVKTQQAGKSAR
jgi:hypothetical protein